MGGPEKEKGLGKTRGRAFFVNQPSVKTTKRIHPRLEVQSLCVFLSGDIKRELQLRLGLKVLRRVTKNRPLTNAGLLHKIGPRGERFTYPREKKAKGRRRGPFSVAKTGGLGKRPEWPMGFQERQTQQGVRHQPGIK